MDGEVAPVVARRRMASSLDDVAPVGLERPCGAEAGDWMHIAPASPGFERIEASFLRHAFGPHRHDTYAIGVTVGGVQAFRYRGAATHSLPGQSFVLHPDEVHDGHAGGDAGFRYRILYIAPGLIRDALPDRARSLPFVREAVSTGGRIAAAIRPALDDLEAPMDELALDQIVADLADALVAADPTIATRPASRIDRRAVDRARDRLEADLARAVSPRELEATTGISRFALARLFRASLGTSPHRYRTMRRLDAMRALIRTGTPLGEAAAACGFADQSHMTRQFRNAYGLPPGRWSAFAGPLGICRGDPI